MTEEKRQEAIRMLQEGLDCKQIAEEVGLPVKAVGGLKARLKIAKAENAGAVEALAVETETEVDETGRMVIGLLRDVLNVIRKIYGV